MLQLKITYFLNKDGLKFFPAWYEEVLSQASQQDGFISMQCDIIQQNPVISLAFENQSKLTAWASTESHDVLADKIEQYFTKPQVVAMQD